MPVETSDPPPTSRRQRGKGSPGALWQRARVAAAAHGPRPLDARLLAAGGHLLATFAGLACISAWAGVFLAYAFGRDRIFDAAGGFGLMSHPLTATALRLLVVGGLGAAAVLAVLARQAHGGRAPGLLLVLTLVAVALDMDALGVAEGLSPAYGGLEPDYSNRVWPDHTRLVAVAVPALGVLAAFTLPLLPRDKQSPGVVAGLAATPYVAFLAGHAVTGQLWAPWEANADYRGDALYRVLPELEVMLLAYLLFGLVTWVDLVLRTGIRLGESGARARWWLLPVLAAAKVFWLLLGLLGLLPVALGGGTVLWDRARDDAIAGWATAVVAGVLVVALYLHTGTRSRAVPSRVVLGIDRDLGLLLLILAAPALLAGVVSLVFSLDWYAFPDTPPKLLRMVVFVAAATVIARSVPATGGSWTGGLHWARAGAVAVAAALFVGLAFSNPLPFDEHLVYTVFSSNGPTLVVGHFFLAVLGCVGLAVAFFVRRGFTALSACVVGLFLLTVAIAHALPLAQSMPFSIDPQLAGATGDLIRPITATEVVPAPAQAWSTWWRGAAGTFTRPTFDAVITFTVLGLALRCRGRSERHQRLRSLLLVLLLVSTVIGQADVVRPTGWFGDRWFYLAFLVPLIYQFLVRADDINRSLRERRPATALATMAGVLLLLTVAGYGASIGSLEPGQSLESQAFAYGRGVTTDFLILIVACAALVAWASRTSPLRGQPGGTA